MINKGCISQKWAKVGPISHELMHYFLNLLVAELKNSLFLFVTKNICLKLCQQILILIVSLKTLYSVNDSQKVIIQEMYKLKLL